MAFPALPVVLRRRQNRIHRGHDSGRIVVGSKLRAAAAACVFLFLAFSWKNPVLFDAPFQKNFKNDKNFVCICEKMGYNKVE